MPAASASNRRSQKKSDPVARTPALPGHVPVLIVGGGPTGLLSANLLGTYGVDTLLVERNGTTSDHPKAILLDDEGLRALQTVGLVDRVIPRVISGYGARYYDSDGNCFADVDSPVTRHGYPRRNSFLQPELEKILHKGLARFCHISAMFETEVVCFKDDGELATAVLKTRDGRRHEISCDFVLACDGAHSTIREQLEISMPGVTDARDWVVIDTINDPDRDRFSKFFCDPRRPMVSIPAPRGGRRYEFMIMPGEDPDGMVATPRIRSVLERFRTIPDEDIQRAVVYTFHARVAERLAVGRTMLLGDAAHMSPPFAGQGMNAGLRDAFNVAWKLKLAIDGVSSPHIVETYETERKDPVTDMVNYAVALGEIVMPSMELDEAAKQTIRANLGGSNTISGNQAMTLRPKPEAIYRDGWRMPTEAPSGRELTGHTLPQVAVETGDGKISLSDDILGPGFSLVAIGDSATEALSHVTGLDAIRLRAKKAAFYTDRPVTEDRAVDTVLMPDEDFGLRSHAGSIVLVRPDRFVAAQWSLDEALGITEQIARLCGSTI